MARWTDPFVKSKNKYSAIKVETDGYSFASKLEAALYQQLKLEMKAGSWKSIQVQDHVYLTTERILYIADFRTECLSLGSSVWHESKGYPTDTWKLKKRLWRGYGPGELRIYTGSHNSLRLTETIISKHSYCQMFGCKPKIE